MLPFIHHSRTSSQKRNAGFSLVEIMVGMVIALLGTIVMMNVFSVFEAQKRTTSGGADVQNNGAITLFSLQNSIEQAGFGLSDLGLLGCSLALQDGYIVPAIAPVTINSPAIPGGDQNTDTLLIMYGNANGNPEGDVINSAGPPGSNPVTDMYDRTPTAFQLYDQVIAAPANRPATCSLKVNSVVGTSTSVVSLNPGVDPTIMPNLPSGATTATGKLFNLGNSNIGNTFKVEVYAIHSGNLTMCDYTINDCSDATKTNDPTVWVPIGNDIVSMRAEYGHDTTSSPGMDGTVDSYDTSTTFTPGTACDLARTSSIRLVLVGRNNQPNPDKVTTYDPSWAGSTPTGKTNNNTTCSTAPSPSDIDLSCTDNNLPPNFTWQNYRYKTFQTTAAIRNIAMKGVFSGC